MENITVEYAAGNILLFCNICQEVFDRFVVATPSAILTMSNFHNERYVKMHTMRRANASATASN